MRIVIAIVGILAAIAIPSLLNAVRRGKQKRTMSDMRAPRRRSSPRRGSRLVPDRVLLDESSHHAGAAPGAGPLHQTDAGGAQRRYNLQSMRRDGSIDPIVCGTTTNFNDDIRYSNAGMTEGGLAERRKLALGSARVHPSAFGPAGWIAGAWCGTCNISSTASP